MCVVMTVKCVFQGMGTYSFLERGKDAKVEFFFCFMEQGSGKVRKERCTSGASTRLVVFKAQENLRSPESVLKLRKFECL